MIAATDGLANADTMVIDVSGYQFFDEQGAAINSTLDVLVGTGASITNIAWDVNLTTFTNPNATFPSWAQEATMTFNSAEDISVAAGVNNGVVNQNFAGSQASALSLPVDGILSIEFWETFDDSLGNADAQFEPGSTITLHIADCFPSPGTISSLGLAGLIASRRRRISD